MPVASISLGGFSLSCSDGSPSTLQRRVSPLLAGQVRRRQESSASICGWPCTRHIAVRETPVNGPQASPISSTPVSSRRCRLRQNAESRRFLLGGKPAERLLANVLLAQ